MTVRRSAYASALTWVAALICLASLHVDVPLSEALHRAADESRCAVTFEDHQHWEAPTPCGSHHDHGSCLAAPTRTQAIAHDVTLTSRDGFEAPPLLATGPAIQPAALLCAAQLRRPPDDRGPPLA